MEQLASAAGVPLDTAQRSKLASYHALIEERGRAMNLTGVHGWERVRDELLLRSLRVVVALRDSEREQLLGSGSRLLDVGTGAGIPGIVLKVALPGLRVTLLEASRKKTDFLVEAVSRLELDAVEVVRGRAEDLGHDPRHRESYDVVTARGVAGLSELAELTLPFCRVGGAALAQKGTGVELEAAEAEWAARLLGAAPCDRRIIDTPGPAAPDTIVLWRKIARTPAPYPRRPGVPHRRPLRAPGSAGAREQRRS